MGAGSSIVPHETRGWATDMDLIRMYNHEWHNEALVDEELIQTRGIQHHPQNSEPSLLERNGGSRNIANGEENTTSRVRARNNTLLRMYNSNEHADLGEALRSVRRAFNRHDIDCTGWITLADASDALTDVGVNATTDTIHLLADAEEKPWRRSWQNYSSDGTIKTDAGNLGLLYWPSIVKCLESAISVEVQEGLAVACEKTLPRNREGPKHSDTDSETGLFSPLIICNKTGGNSSRTFTESSATKIASPLDGSQPDRGAIEATPEPLNELSHDDKNETDDCHVSVGADASCISIEYALCTLEMALRSESIRNCGYFTQRREAETTVPEATVMDTTVENTMRKIRDVLDFAREQELHHFRMDIASAEGTRVDNRHGGKDGEASFKLSGNSGEARGLEKMEEASKRPSARIENYPAQTTVTCAVVDEMDNDSEDLTSLACEAGKTGDIDTLKDLGNMIDLRKNGPFGRNAMYYACLCGHVDAVHFIATHAYGGVKGIPPAELWECRKNALTVQLRHYLNSGRLPGKNQDSHQSSKDSTRQPIRQMNAQSTEWGKNVEQAGRTVTRSLSTTALQSMASVFGDNHEDMEDY